MAYSLDKIDTQILDILQKDSNQTTKRIAEQLSMTTSPVFERIKKLEKEGYIKKYVAVLDNKKIVKCTNCGSTNTIVVSQFGSTACKALFKCEDCKEPFDYFKCL